MFLWPIGRSRWIFVGGLAGVVVSCSVIGCQEKPSIGPGGTVETTSDADAIDERSMLVGTWRLVRVERYDHTGIRLTQSPAGTFAAGKSLGWLMYDGAHMAVVIQGDDLSTYSARQPIPNDTLAAVTSYLSYFGPYSVNASEGYVIHHVLGSLNPGQVGAEYQRYYELEGNQLTLIPPLSCPDSYVRWSSSDARDMGCAYGTIGIQLKIIWEKVLAQRDIRQNDSKLFGFWAINSVERKTLDGELIGSEQFSEGYLAYMPSGYMSVQLMRHGRVQYEGVQPSAIETESAMRSYVNYAGSFTVNADEGYVLHHQAVNLNPNEMDAEVQKDYKVIDDQLVLIPPVRLINSQEIQSSIHWNRISTIGG